MASTTSGTVPPFGADTDEADSPPNARDDEARRGLGITHPRDVWDRAGNLLARYNGGRGGVSGQFVMTAAFLYLFIPFAPGGLALLEWTARLVVGAQAAGPLVDAFLDSRNQDGQGGSRHQTHERDASGSDRDHDSSRGRPESHPEYATIEQNVKAVVDKAKGLSGEQTRDIAKDLAATRRGNERAHQFLEALAKVSDIEKSDILVTVQTQSDFEGSRLFAAALDSMDSVDPNPTSVAPVAVAAAVGFELMFGRKAETTLGDLTGGSAPDVRSAVRASLHAIDSMFSRDTARQSTRTL